MNFVSVQSCPHSHLQYALIWNLQAEFSISTIPCLFKSYYFVLFYRGFQQFPSIDCFFSSSFHSLNTQFHEGFTAYHVFPPIASILYRFVYSLVLSTFFESHFVFASFVRFDLSQYVSSEPIVMLIDASVMFTYAFLYVSLSLLFYSPFTSIKFFLLQISPSQLLNSIAV